MQDLDSRIRNELFRIHSTDFQSVSFIILLIESGFRPESVAPKPLFSTHNCSVVYFHKVSSFTALCLCTAATISSFSLFFWAVG